MRVAATVRLSDEDRLALEKWSGRLMGAQHFVDSRGKTGGESAGASDCLKFVQWLSCFLLKSCVLNRLFCWSTWFRSRVKKPL